jgi:predicted MFS family arabinose efflux permease
MPSTLRTALALALGAAVSLGLARFSYALLLPTMCADLGWSYLTAGAMNTVNAAGYLAGALLTVSWLKRHAARRVFLWGSAIAGATLIGHGFVVDDRLLYLLRFLTGVASAATFIAGGLLAARLAGGVPTADRDPGAGDRHASRGPSHAGLILGVYYGGTGIGIVASALLVPVLIPSTAVHAWQHAWIGLGVVALFATAVMAAATRHLDAQPSRAAARSRFSIRAFAFGLAAYFLFGLGYIGYMTFVITLLREMHLAEALITSFYIALGIAVFASSWLWARLLQRCRGGEAMTVLDALLAAATLLPVLSAHPLAVFASGLLFGGVFLSVVASTTALVRHNVEASAWSAGISAFTIVFAAGQIVGPTLIGWVADGAGGLRGGFVCSAVVLVLAAVLAWQQKALAHA